MSTVRWFKTVSDRAENTGPLIMPRSHIMLEAMARVDAARQRRVMAEAEMDRSRLEYDDARHALARLMTEYGLMSLVDGQPPPPADEE